MDEEKNIIDEVNEMQDEIHENEELTEEAGGSSLSLKILSGILTAIVGFLTGKALYKLYKGWKAKREAKKAEKDKKKEDEKNEEIIKKALKEYAEKHPEEFITDSDVEVEEDPEK